MGYIDFDKTQLINLEYSLTKELIRSNRAGSYASTTIVNCNTRKYHGLLICPLPELDGGNHVLLSNIHETVIQREREFNIGINKYPNSFHPTGHKYIADFHINPIPTLRYRVGGVILEKETLLAEEAESVMVRYTLIDAHSETKIQIKPFLAFRNIHSLSKANMNANTKITPADNGIRTKLYTGYPNLYMQISKKAEFIQAPDWYYNIEYMEEAKRGYDYLEDLYVPGFFEFTIKKGESVVFCAGLSEVKHASLNKLFESEVKKRIPRDNYEQCLQSAAQQFFIRKDNKTKLVSGYPWLVECRSRDAFIALPGLTLPMNDIKTCKSVLDTMSKEIKDGLFKHISDSTSHYNSADAPLWFFWAVQQYVMHTKKYEEAWKDWGKKLIHILESYKHGTMYNIKMMDNGLIYAGVPGHALTWMDAFVNGKPVTPRIGSPVEINALWYNAIMFALELADIAGDQKFVDDWKDLPAKVSNSFLQNFFDYKKGYLADYIDGQYKDWSVRPNQIIAASLHYSPIEDETIKKSIVDTVQRELLTPKGLRTLSPKNPEYKAEYTGDQQQRDAAYHQGTVWVWLLGHFCEAYLKLHQQSGVSLVEKLYKTFEEELSGYGIGTIGEIFDGNPPHEAKGAMSQAWSVAELLRINMMLTNFR